MIKLLYILLVLIANALSAQNFWEPVNFPDTLFSKAINAIKTGLYSNHCASIR